MVDVPSTPADADGDDDAREPRESDGAGRDDSAASESAARTDRASGAGDALESETADAGPPDRSPAEEDAASDDEVDSEEVDTAERGAFDTEEFDPDELSENELRRAVEEKYDFDDFGPSDMAEMTLEEWEVAFDPETWITGRELIDRVETDLRRRIAHREVFAVLERVRAGDDELLLAYSDQDYALVYPDGSVEGTGTVLRDVKPSVALCSMESYEPEEPPEGDFLLPAPDEVPEQSGELGNLMLQVVAAVQLLAGVGLLGASVYFGTAGSSVVGTALVTGIAGLGFLVIGLFLFLTVANARLSDRFRAEEYRERLRSVGLEDGERPDFLPVEGPDAEFEPVGSEEERAE